MSNEKKNEVTEEVKEEARELTEEELEKVIGGINHFQVETKGLVQALE